MKILLNAKCSDMCQVALLGADNELMAEHIGYVPPYIPNDWGDYVVLEIDPDTGVILNWNAAAVKEAIARGLK